MFAEGHANKYAAVKNSVASSRELSRLIHDPAEARLPEDSRHGTVLSFYEGRIFYPAQRQVNALLTG
jgi:hypothetical protein